MFRNVPTRTPLSKPLSSSIHRRLSDVRQQRVIAKARNPERNNTIVTAAYPYDINPYLLSSAMPQPTHKSHFKTLRSNNSYHPYHPPILTPQSIAFRQRTTLSIKKRIYPIHYRLSYLERLGFIKPITQTYIEIRPGVILCTLNDTTE